VRLVEQSSAPFASAASAYAGVMLAPDCEGEAAPALVTEMGRAGLALWRETYPGVTVAGTLIVAAARDQPELVRFSKVTARHRLLDAEGLAALEPDLAGRFSTGLYFPEEAHMPAPHALAFLLEAVRAAGAEVRLGETWQGGARDDGFIIDCRGLAAKDELPELRGVRGERVLVATRDIRLSRPVRLLHPRHPLYVVPWGDGRFVVGATVIESEDAGPVTLRSALELLGAAYALHPAFGEAQVLDMGAGVRPAFPDNVPRAFVRSERRLILVNGAYRHGFLLAPMLAEAVAGFLGEGAAHPLLAEE
jgi:glycine oxidase